MFELYARITLYFKNFVTKVQQLRLVIILFKDVLYTQYVKPWGCWKP